MLRQLDLQRLTAIFLSRSSAAGRVLARRSHDTRFSSRTPLSFFLRPFLCVISLYHCVYIYIYIYYPPFSCTRPQLAPRSPSEPNAARLEIIKRELSTPGEINVRSVHRRFKIILVNDYQAITHTHTRAPAHTHRGAVRVTRRSFCGRPTVVRKLASNKLISDLILGNPLG